MALRVAILTTDTPHHRYFLRHLERDRPAGVDIVLNVFEERSYPWRRKARQHVLSSLPNLWQAFAMNPYLQSNALTQSQIAFEESRYFPDGDDSLPRSFPTRSVFSVNNDEARRLIDAAAPDLLIVYGTGVLRPAVFAAVRQGAINAHGGLLPGYRGLDTNLWAALEGAPEDMAISIHRIDEGLDTGPVYLQRRLGAIPGLDIVTLRYHVALLCTDAIVEVLRKMVGGVAEAAAQVGESRYYGPMPQRLKMRADKIIRAYVEGSGAGRA